MSLRSKVHKAQAALSSAHAAYRMVSPAKLYSRVTVALSSASFPVREDCAVAVAAVAGGGATVGRGMRNSMTLAFFGCALPVKAGVALGFICACMLARRETFGRSPNSASNRASKSGAEAG